MLTRFVSTFTGRRVHIAYLDRDMTDFESNNWKATMDYLAGKKTLCGHAMYYPDRRATSATCPKCTKVHNAE